MKNHLSVLALLSVPQLASAHTSSASAAIHAVEHAMVPAICVLAVVVLLIAIKNKRL